jgi:predicted ATPase
MLIKGLKVEQYRGLDGLEVKDLGRFSLVVGANNSGKSTLLEAISLLLRPLDPSQWISTARQRDMDADLVDALWSLFPHKGILQLSDGPQQSNPIKLNASLRDEERRLDVRAVAAEDWDAEESGAATLRVSAKVNERPRHDMLFRRDKQAEWGQGEQLYRCFTVTPLTHRSGRALVEHLSRVVDEGDKALALELLQLFDPEVVSLDVSAGRRRQTVVVKHAARGMVDLASFGDGMRRVVALALALSRAKDGALLIDELEAGIHPSVLPEVVARLLAAAKAAGVQIIATTHSLEAIDALIHATQAEAGPAPGSTVAYYLHLRDGVRSVRRYNQDKLQSLREAGVDLR